MSVWWAEIDDRRFYAMRGQGQGMTSLGFCMKLIKGGKWQAKVKDGETSIFESRKEAQQWLVEQIEATAE